VNIFNVKHMDSEQNNADNVYLFYERLHMWCRSESLAYFRTNAYLLQRVQGLCQRKFVYLHIN